MGRVSAVALAVVALAAGSARAELFGIFYDGSNNDFLGAISPASGEITTRGSVLDVAGRIGGVSDSDPATGHFFFVGAQGAASAMSIWTVDVSDGSVVGAHTISMTGFSSGPFCIRWDEVNHRLLAIMAKMPGMGTLATISLANGATAAIGAGFAVDGFSSGVCAFDAASQRLYLAAPIGGNPALLRINASTGALLTSPAITTGLPGVTTTPGFLAWDDAGGRVLGIVNLSPSSAGKVLVSINTTTGALTLLSDAIPAGGYSSGVSAYEESSQTLYFLANDVATNMNNSVFGVTTGGDITANQELFSDFVGLFTTSSFLVLVPEPDGAALGAAALAALRLLA